VSSTVLLVDYENVGHIDLTTLPSDMRVVVFFGASQRKVPTALLKTVAQLGERFIQVDIQGQGKNALDFHIAFYLGEYLTRSPETRCAILSKDTGFDPLVQHLRGRNLRVIRVSSLTEVGAKAAPKAVVTPVPGPGVVPAAVPKVVPKDAPGAGPQASRVQPLSAEKVVHWLRGTQKKKRPRKRKSLVAHLHSHFGQKMLESDIQKIVEELISKKHLIETNGAITYYF
jgi:hypothetical protein